MILLVTLWCLAQMLYMPSYRDLMPLSSFFLLGNVGDTVARSALGAFRLGDLEVLLPPVVLYIVYRIWLKRPLESTSFSPAKRLVLSLMCVLAFVVIRLGVSAVSYNNDKETASFNQQLTNDYCVMWTRQGDYVNKNGVVSYLVYGFVSSIYNQTTLTDDQKQQVTRFINEQAQNGDDYASARGKNVILLVVESLNSWVVGLDIDGKEVTPTLNALCKDTENNLVTLNMRSQVKNGRSSDGIFMYNTGLLPLEPALWNVENMAKNYGYKEFYGKTGIADALKSNGYLLDKALLDEVSSCVLKYKQPFIALVATAGMHHPYNSPMEPETWLQQSGKYTSEVRCYLECVNAFDSALASFIQDLKSKGLYDNTMLVIVSDHSEMVDDSPQGRPSIDKEGDRCVFLVVNSGQNGIIGGPVGQIDVFPTLIELLGVRSHHWNGLGNSMLHGEVTSVAISPSQTMGSGPLLERQKQAWRISDMIISSRWFEPRE